MNTLAISAVIPLYNKGKYVARTSDSFSAQTYRDFEVVVIDDKAICDSLDVVHQYNDSLVRLIRQANAGPGAAQNQGIKHG